MSCGKRKADSDVSLEQRWAIIARIMLYTNSVDGKLKEIWSYENEHGTSRSAAYKILEMPDLSVQREEECGTMQFNIKV